MTRESDLLRTLREAVRGEVSGSPARIAEYASDASNYRVPPRVVVFPLDPEDLLAVAEVSRSTGVPLTVRGGGTSVAGNAIGPGIVADTSVHMNRVLEVDADARAARVQPGLILADLQSAAAPHGLRFGPDPSTMDRATLGGMIGNDACGPHALAYGRTSDNVVALDVVDGMGRRFTAGRGLAPVAGLAELVGANVATIRLEFGTFGRQVSGYSLEHLLPDRGGDLARALVGTEGTVVTVLEATVRLVPVTPSPVLIVLGYPDMASAADVIPALLAHRPLAIEGLDRRLVDVVRRHLGAGHVPDLPAGGGWLLVETGGSDAREARDAAERLARDVGTDAVRVLPAGREAAAIWRIRADGAGLAGRTQNDNQAWPGWEDAAVPPARLGAYLRAFETLMASHRVSGIPYGHFGDGCVHIRLDIPLDRDGSALRAFITDAADLVIAHGGSPSGEHGDGRARSELLARLYSADALALMGSFKRLLDPQNLLNPGIVVTPAALDANLRRPAALPIAAHGGFAFADDGGDFTRAVHRCTGIARCRADATATGGFMCPSYLATRDENDVTRGRARVLQDLTRGTFGVDGWRSASVESALDLCLACRACSRDCPSNVDMARYKAEVLHRRFRGRLRPVSHYVLGWLPRWAALGRRMPRLVNAVTRHRRLTSPLLRLGGMDPRRSIPALAVRPFRREVATAPRPAARPRVVLWVDSFSNAFAPGTPQAAVRLLEAAGYDVLIPRQRACCGLTWITTGQLDGARGRLRHLLDVLGPHSAVGIPIVGLEPSCTAVLRSDLVELLPEDPRSRLVGMATRTLAEVLSACGASGEPGWRPPDLDGLTVIVQPHCHQYAVMGFEPDLDLLRACGAQVTSLAGCCGMAGSFGMEKGHYAISVAVAEHALLPALRTAPAGAVFLADGFSCRTQAAQLAGVSGVSLAELLASRLPARDSAQQEAAAGQVRRARRP